jgi:hypothetical protein
MIIVTSKLKTQNSSKPLSLLEGQQREGACKCRPWTVGLDTKVKAGIGWHLLKVGEGRFQTPDPQSQELKGLDHQIITRS